MNIKKMIICAAGMMALGLSSCSSDEPANGGGQETDNGNLYARIQLFVPGGSRSATDDFDGTTNSEDGFEIGKTYENNVNDVTVVLATYDSGSKTYTPVAVSTSAATPAPGSSNDAPVFNIVFRHDEIKASAEKTVYIFAYCNAQSMLNPATDFTASTFTDKIATIASADEEQGIWAPGNFLMVNAPNIAIPAVTLPSEAQLISAYNSPEKALDLGTVDVARAAARFDFKQLNSNLYDVYDVNAEVQNDESRIAQVQILAMAPVNIAKDFYLLPRVSGDGTDENWEYCGVETRNNWVVSPYWNDKKQDLAGSGLLAKFFYQTPTAVYSDEEYFNYTYLSNFNGEEDDDANWGTGLSATDKSGYRIWRYVTENTLPAVASQKKGVSTGVVFKAEIKNAKPGTILAQTMDAGKPVYSYLGTMYGDVAALRRMAASLNENNPLYKAYVKVFGTETLAKGDNGEFTVADADLVDATSDKNANTFKIYRPTKDLSGVNHYYVYYLYRNRHNDNKNNNQMAAMEFGTVRNNIYKLSITSISDFGHTGTPGDDPDPENPDDPDESPKTYLKVACRVVPWMVRVNNIEF